MSYRIAFILGTDPRLLGGSLNILLATLTMLDRAYLEAHPETPPLYDSGIRYRTDLQDDWQDVPTTLALKTGDAEDLACFRAAELQKQGVMAWPTAEFGKSSITGRFSFRTRVRLPNGTFENPAHRLGLHGDVDPHADSSIGHPVSLENRITFSIDLFHGKDDEDVSHRTLQLLLHALFLIDMRYLLAHPETPGIYQAGVVYKEEPPGREEWQDIPSTLRRGNGDCEDLATWLAAQRRVRDKIPAWPVFKWAYRPSGNVLYHIQDRYPDGSIEDPSAKLGMGR